jgi:hypothetical protein
MKTSKTQKLQKLQKPFGTKRKVRLQGRAGFFQEISFLKSESGFKSDFFRVEVPIFSAAIAR